ncbi:MAG: DUF4124 domain-containing protein [Betaproteobacteria bacterium]|nr:DUF4124 domain-containing protein [Betaproteobacteria bacterium]
MGRRWIVALAIALLPATASSAIYRWTDSRHEVHYSSARPQGRPAVRLTLPSAGPVAPAVRRQEARELARAQALAHELAHNHARRARRSIHASGILFAKRARQCANALGLLHFDEDTNGIRLIPYDVARARLTLGEKANLAYWRDQVAKWCPDP